MRYILDKIIDLNKRSNISTFHSSISSLGQNKAILCSVCIILFIITAVFLCPPMFSDDDYSNAITGTSIASDTTLSISLSNSILPLDITPTSSSGTFATTADDDTGASTAVIHVSTNNITGYTLGIKASNPASSAADKLISSNEQCEDTPTSTKCSISSLPQAVSEEDYISNTVEGIDLNNTWGYLPSKYNSEDNTNYLPAPVAGDTIAVTSGPNPEDTATSNVKSGTDNNNELLEDEYTIDFGMRIDFSPYAGTYSTAYNDQSYIITAVGNLVPYSVSYNSNKPEQAPTEANVDNMPTAQAGNVSSGDTIAVLLSQKVPTLGTVNPSTGNYDYAGYVFAGWCTVQPEEDQITGYQTCPDDARVFQPGDNFGIDQTVDNTQTLYATWGAPARVTFDSNGLVFDDTVNNTRNNTPKRMSLSTTKRDASVNDTNMVEIIPTYEDGKITGKRINMFYTGSYKEPVYEPTDPPTNYIFKGWSTTQDTANPTYIGEDAILGDFQIEANEDTTLYAIWAYATVITFDGNGADSGTMEQFTIEAGKTEALPQNTFTKTNYYFVGWNTEADESGDSYKNQSSYTAAVGSNNVTLYAEWTDCAPNHICYNDNDANSPITMSDQTTNYNYSSDLIVSDMEVNLWPMNYKYDTNNDGYNDYGFAGWSEDKNAASKILDANPDNNPTIYGPNQTITIGDVSVYGLKLYAVWMPVAKDSTNADLTFQTTNLLTTTLADGSTLASKSNGYVTALKDQRDNQVYAVARLADGNYWMIENLRLDDTHELSVTNTNSPSLPLMNNNDGVTSNFLSATSDSWCTKRTPTCYGQSYLSTANTTNVVVEMTSPNNNIFSYGNYYNWYSATAGNGTYYTFFKAAGDICPFGWKLPLGAFNKDTPRSFSHLDAAMGGTGESQSGVMASNRWRSFPNNFIYSGSWGGPSSYDQGYEGNYWSLTGDTYYSARKLNFNSFYTYPGTDFDNYNKNSGYSVRCVNTQ